MSYKHFKTLIAQLLTLFGTRIFFVGMSQEEAKTIISGAETKPDKKKIRKIEGFGVGQI